MTTLSGLHAYPPPPYRNSKLSVIYSEIYAQSVLFYKESCSLEIITDFFTYVQYYSSTINTTILGGIFNYRYF